MASTTRTGWAFPDMSARADLTAIQAWGDKVGGDIGAPAYTSTTRPATGNYVGRTIQETDTGMIRVWTGSRWRWIGGTPQRARYALGPQALNTAAISNLTIGAKQSDSTDPASIFSAAGTSLTVGVAGVYVVSWGGGLNVSSPDMTTFLTLPAGIVPSPIRGGMAVKSGDLPTTTTPLLPLSAGQSVSLQTYVYSTTTTLSSGYLQIHCVSEA